MEYIIQKVRDCDYGEIVKNFKHRSRHVGIIKLGSEDKIKILYTANDLEDDDSFYGDNIIKEIEASYIDDNRWSVVLGAKNQEISSSDTLADVYNKYLGSCTGELHIYKMLDKDIYIVIVSNLVKIGNYCLQGNTYLFYSTDIVDIDEIIKQFNILCEKDQISYSNVLMQHTNKHFI